MCPLLTGSYTVMERVFGLLIYVVLLLLLWCVVHMRSFKISGLWDAISLLLSLTTQTHVQFLGRIRPLLLWHYIGHHACSLLHTWLFPDRLLLQALFDKLLLMFFNWVNLAASSHSVNRLRQTSLPILCRLFVISARLIIRHSSQVLSRHWLCKITITVIIFFIIEILIQIIFRIFYFLPNFLLIE